MPKQASKGRIIRKMIAEKPELNNFEIGKLVGASPSYVHKIRINKSYYIPKAQRMTTPEPKSEPQVEDTTPEELDTVLEAASVMVPNALNAVLEERGLRYGTFLKRAIIAQRLKAVMADTPNWIAINDDMAESLEMIAHKISRILGGDPMYADSWVDIAGYAQLVADRLNGKER